MTFKTPSAYTPNSNEINVLAVSTTTTISSTCTTMSEGFRVQLNDLRHLLRHVPHSLPLPQLSEVVYPFANYTIDGDWLDRIESEEGVVDRDLEITFADRSIQEDSLEGLINFHEHGPSLEVVDVIEKYWTGHASDPLAKWVEDITRSVLHVYSTEKKVGAYEYDFDLNKEREFVNKHEFDVENDDGVDIQVPLLRDLLSSTPVEGMSEGLREHAVTAAATETTGSGSNIFTVEEDIVF